MDAINQLDRFRGSLLGLATADALGTTLEFQAPGSFTPINDMLGGGPFNLAPGQWTDDTSMALCLAESLVEQQGFDPVDQLKRYTRWYREGYLSSTGRCFDIGNTVRAALWAFYHGQSFKEGCLLAVNLGDDADTTAAVYGQLAGAHYGQQGIPNDWLDKVAFYDLIASLAEQLFKNSEWRIGCVVRCAIRHSLFATLRGHS